ncbi:polysaccharide deacetylase family protein [Streptomyces zhihengii]
MTRSAHDPAAGRRLLVRVLLGALAAAVAAIPFLAAWQHRTDRFAVEEQLSPAAAPPPAAGAPALRGLPRDTGPVVLAYHDVRPDGERPYTVTPAAFDAQLAALRAAGYRTLSTAEFVRHLRGERVPGRTVYLTFDDGAQGLWRYADRSLARHGMRAAAYLITGQVGERHTYYLSWEEVRRMASSGRWDFQSHTDDLHRRLPLDASGARLGPALTERLWLPAERRRETPAEYRTRVAADLDRSIDAITSRGLPKPLLFAYPFSESHGSGPSGAGVLQGMLRQRFTAALTNHHGPHPLGAGAGLRRTDRPAPGDHQRHHRRRPPRRARRTRPPPPRRRAAALGGARRVGVPRRARRHHRGRLHRRRPVPAGARPPLRRVPPLATADWTGYTAEASVDGLHSTANGVSLTVRAHGGRPVLVALSRANVRVTEGTGAARRTVARARLEPAARHTLRIVVTADATEVRVDGRLRARVPVPPSAAGGHATGGVALGVHNDGAPRWPAFRTLTVAQTRPAAPAESAPEAPHGRGHGRTAP